MKITNQFIARLSDFKQILLNSTLIGLLLFLMPDWNQQLLAATNATQQSVQDARNIGCGSGDKSVIRCGTYPVGGVDGDIADQQVSPEQTGSTGANANKTSSNQTSSWTKPLSRQKNPFTDTLQYVLTVEYDNWSLP